MAKFRLSIQPFFSDSLFKSRHLWQLTQEKMAELLRISSRAYRELEKGRSSCSAETLVFFLAQMTVEDAWKTIQTWAGKMRASEEKFPAADPERSAVEQKGLD